MAARKSTTKKSNEDTLARALLDKAAEVEALKSAVRSGMAHAVTVENCGYAQLAFVTDDGKTIIVPTKGARRRVAIPLHTYERYKRETNWFDKGFARIVGEPVTNVNVVESPQEWVDNTTEREAAQTIAQFQSPGPINTLWFYLVGKEERTGKELFIMRELSKQHEALTGALLVEDIV